MLRHRVVLRFALALLVLLGQFASYAHLAAVQHVTCEHGDYVELHAANDAALTAHDLSRAAIVADEEDGHEHDHCAATPNTRTGSVTPALHAQTLSLPRAHATSLPATPTLTPAIALHRLAPKNSPPVLSS